MGAANLVQTIADEIASRGWYVLHGDRVAILCDGQADDPGARVAELDRIARENQWQAEIRDQGNVVLFTPLAVKAGSFSGNGSGGGNDSNGFR